MSIKTLTLQAVEAAIAENKAIFQIFNRTFTKVFFILKEDYELGVSNAESDLYKLKSSGMFKTKGFDNDAFEKFCEEQSISYGTKRSKLSTEPWLLTCVKRMYAGIELVTSHEDIIDCFYNRDTREPRKDNKFGPEHFPPGTQFTLSYILASFYTNAEYPSVFTVQGIVQNGPNSFILETTADDMQELSIGEKYSFNISHVENIVLRGKGPVKLHVPQTRQISDVSVNFPALVKKGYWLTHGSSATIFGLTSRLTVPTGTVLDAEALNDQLMKQSFVKEAPRVAGYFPTLWLINKKRAKRFVKQNLNRFLSSAKQAQVKRDETWNFYEDTDVQFSERTYANENVDD